MRFGKGQVVARHERPEKRGASKEIGKALQNYFGKPSFMFAPTPVCNAIRIFTACIVPRCGNTIFVGPGGTSSEASWSKTQLIGAQQQNLESELQKLLWESWISEKRKRKGKTVIWKQEGEELLLTWDLVNPSAPCGRPEPANDFFYWKTQAPSLNSKEFM